MRISSEHIEEVSARILSEDFDWIRNVHGFGRKYDWQRGYVDLCILAVMQRENYSIPHKTKLEMREIAIFRGWMTTFVYIQTTFQIKIWPAIEDCKFWNLLSDVCMDYVKDPIDEYDDQYVYDTISNVNSDHLMTVYMKWGLVECCLGNAFTKSAKFLLSLQDLKILNPTAILDDEGWRVADVLFHKGMVRCIKLSKETLLWLSKYSNPPINGPVWTEIKCKDEAGCHLLKLFHDVEYKPRDYEMILAYADIMHCELLKSAIMHINKTESYWPDMRKETKFVRDYAFYDDLDTVKLLVKRGYAVNTPGREFSIIHELLTAVTGHSQVHKVRCLCDLGADMRKKDSRGRMPLHMIAFDYDEDTLDVALDNIEDWVGSKEESLDDMGRSLLHYIAACPRFGCGEDDMYLKIWNRLDYDILDRDLRGYNSIQYCARSGNMIFLQLINDETVYLRNMEDAFAMTLLDAAAEGCRRSVVDYLLPNCCNGGDLLIPHKVKVAALLNTKINHGCNVGKTLMFVACQIGPRDRVCGFLDFLISKGASVHINDTNGNTLMHAVATCDTVRDETTEIARFYPGDPRYHYIDDESRLNNPDNIKLPCLAGGGRCIPILKKLFQLEPAMLSHKNRSGKTPMISALYQANHSAVASFLSLAERELSRQSFIDFIHSSDETGVSPLYLALILHNQLASESNVKIHHRYLKIAELLIGYGALIDVHVKILIKTLKEREHNNKSLSHVLSMARIRIPHMYKDRTVGRLAKLPRELFESVTIDAVNDKETQELKSRLLPPRNFWERSEEGEMSDDEDFMQT
jgi:ankyrin repeat protein